MTPPSQTPHEVDRSKFTPELSHSNEKYIIPYDKTLPKFGGASAVPSGSPQTYPDQLHQQPARTTLIDDNQPTTSSTGESGVLWEEIKPGGAPTVTQQRFCGLRKRTLGIILVLALIIAIGVGFGVGVGVSQKNHEASSSSTSSATSSPLFPATSGQPSLPTAAFNLSISSPSTLSNRCFGNINEIHAWGCDITPSPFSMNLTRTSDQDSSYLLSLGRSLPSAIEYGMQQPIINITRRGTLVTVLNDSQRGLAYLFRGVYDKIVVLQSTLLNETLASKKRDQGEVLTSDRRFNNILAERQRGEPGFALLEIAWFCYWNATSINVYIYPQENGTSSESSDFLTTTAYYPRTVRIEDTYLRPAVKPYCQEFVINRNGTATKSPVCSSDTLENIVVPMSMTARHYGLCMFLGRLLMGSEAIIYISYQGCLWISSNTARNCPGPTPGSIAFHLKCKFPHVPPTATR